MSDFHALKIAAVERLTPSSVALTLEIPDSLKTTFQFKAGQYITIKHQENGQELRRSYSISCAPSSGRLTVGIKKMPNGTSPTPANENLRAGDLLEVFPPEGRFVFEGQGPQHIAAFAAGSGITPIMSIAQTVLEGHPQSSFVLVFGNQSPLETMYSKELRALEETYTDRFFIQHVYSRVNEAGALYGHIEKSTVNFILRNKFKETSFDAHYLCGPQEMIQLVSDTLKGHGIEEGAIHFELFTSEDTEDTLAEELEGKTRVTVV